MRPNDYNTNTTIIDDNATLQQFYGLTNELSRIRKVRFTSKHDEIDNIEWNFKYRGYPLSLNYSIYSGVTLTPQNSKDAKVVIELAGKLKSKTAHQ
ncbi:hypothetical protein FRZ67_10040 [Panacibacter ginsenosidivorans]|uniref:DUF3630 family protein n=1 Tax=Panacibacter ginsenosidivorans TaxID=1813871 RepID=A0A5B8V9L8_9BACT|nr:hypothetical protein [Panacibacter ginsenosidivorans]QEC67613.1 hypothetical protein FRZ67_10040 [Panacibacter ginsenosidivorans]